MTIYKCIFAHKIHTETNTKPAHHIIHIIRCCNRTRHRTHFYDTFVKCDYTHHLSHHNKSINIRRNNAVPSAQRSARAAWNDTHANWVANMFGILWRRYSSAVQCQANSHLHMHTDRHSNTNKQTHRHETRARDARVRALATALSRAVVNAPSSHRSVRVQIPNDFSMPPRELIGVIPCVIAF